MPKDLSPQALQAINVAERICSVLSLVGCLLIMTTFCISKSFHKPINRLIFFACFGNIFSNIGTLMGQAYIDSPNSFPCQLQAFLVQLFMPADAFWSLAMAINVYLTFYFKFDAASLRKMELPYVLCCYGIPLIPAFIFLWITDGEGRRMYGDATLWCWISDGWEVWRIATFYGPVWLSIVITLFIYARAGRTIYEKRRELNRLTAPSINKCNNGCESRKTTEVSVTSTTLTMDVFPDYQEAAQPPAFHETQNTVPPTRRQYSVIVSAEPNLTQRLRTILPTTPQSTHFPECQSSTRQVQETHHRHVHETNSATWAYTKCAILFFTAILVTWLPSSANRVFSIINKNEHSAALEIMSALVLPLQGFWNAVVYFFTSWSACKTLMHDLRQGRRPGMRDLAVGRFAFNWFSWAGGRQRSPTDSRMPIGDKQDRSESMRKLSDRGGSDDERFSS